MNVQILPAVAQDARRLSCLFQLYVYDFSDLLGLDLDEDGQFQPPAFDGIDEDLARSAFLFRVEGRLAGFALVRQGSVLTGDPLIWDMGEFFVMRRYRRTGVGETSARALFDRFRGPWEVRQRPENAAGTAFWRRVIGRYTAAPLEEFFSNDSRWQGPVQRFRSRGAP